LPGGEEENIDDLRGRINELNKELAVQLVAESRYREIEEENQKLKNLLNFLDGQDYRTIGAALIAREEAAKGGYDLIIDRGAADGLRTGLGVINEEGIIIGLVKEVKKNTAEICLITTPDCRLAATIQNEDRTQGIADGDLGLTVKMEYIPQTEKINLGDIVISSGLGGDIPRGLVIGRVAQIRSESNDVWQEATIEPLVNFNDLTVVAVVIP
jgi:rod shape-determining protein MreC